MLSQTQPGPLAGFENLSDCISIYKPPAPDGTATRKPAANEPKMALLCTWLGNASLRRIEKYTKKYQQLLPHAQILLIQARIPDMTVRTFAQQRRRLEPAREAIRALTSACAAQQSEESRNKAEGYIVLHMFSHGGSNTAIQLALSIEESKLALPLQAVIFDGTPGNQSFGVSYNAMTLSLPQNPVSRFLCNLAIYPALGALTSLSALGVLVSIDDMRRVLNDEKLFGKSTPRLYLYSKEDAMIHWKDVELHMQDAREKGYPVTGVLFEKGPHCSLVIEGAERYWAAVQELWETVDVQQDGNNLTAAENTNSTLPETRAGGKL